MGKLSDFEGSKDLDRKIPDIYVYLCMPVVLRYLKKQIDNLFIHLCIRYKNDA